MTQSSNAASASAVADTPWDAAAVYNPATVAPSIGLKRKWHMVQETMQLTLNGGLHGEGRVCRDSGIQP
jgi:hypothetical protein